MRFFFKRERMAITPPGLDFVPHLIVEANTQMRKAIKKPHWFGRLVYRGDVYPLNPDPQVLSEWMNSLEGVQTDGLGFDPGYFNLELIKRGRSRILHFKSHDLLGSGADLWEYNLTVDPKKGIQISYVVKEGSVRASLEKYLKLPRDNHFELTRLLIATAQPRF